LDISGKGKNGATLGIADLSNYLVLKNLCVWGVWFGRKCCLPAAPLYRAGPCDEATAWHALVGDAPHEQFSRVEEVNRFEDGTDSIQDQPLSFGTADSSGPEGRKFVPRRVKVIPRSL
jgi:CRISPR system Cascade subunit CasD